MQQFGHYEIASVIGRGGMGEVYRAHDTRRDRDVALKLLPESVSNDPEYQNRFRRESYAVARLREPHIVPIHDYGDVGGRLFIDMRLVDGESLAALLGRSGALSPDRAIALIKQIAEALDAAHADGVVHRDIKPSNILVTPSDFVYVADFGLAHAVGHTRSRLTAAGVTLGTLDYMAPERFENRPVDARTDVYSLACLLFECVTGAKPFLGHDLPSQMYAHMHLDPRRPSEIDPTLPSGLDAVVARGMAKDPDARFATAGELAAAAAAAVRAGPATAVVATGDGIAVPSSTPSGNGDRVAPAMAGGAAGTAADSAGGSPGPVGVLPPPPPGSVPPPRPTPGGGPAGPAGPGAPPPASPGRAGGFRKGPVLVLVAVLAAVAVLFTVLLVGGSSNTAGAPSTPAAPGKSSIPVAKSVAKPTVGATVPVGATPGYMEIAPNGEYGYIANRAAGVLTVFDTTRNITTGTIPVPDGGPQFVAFSPDGSRAYVTIFNQDYTLNQVGVLDTDSGSFVARIPTGVRPFALDVTPDGKKLFVPNHDSGSITVIDTESNSVVNTIKVAPNPHWLDISPDGTRLYAANHESNVLTTIDTATDAVLGTVPVGRSPHSILRHSTKPIVINANYDDSTISVTDTNSGRVIATVPTASHPQDVTLSADGRYVYIAAVDANAIQVLDTQTFQITATVPTGKGPTSVAVAPDGRQAYVTNLLDGSVTVLNLAGTA